MLKTEEMVLSAEYQGLSTGDAGNQMEAERCMNEQTKKGHLQQSQMTAKDGRVGKKQIEVKGTEVRQ